MGGGNYFSYLDEPVPAPEKEPKRASGERAVSYPGHLREAVQQGLSDPDPENRFDTREPLKSDLWETERRTFESSEGGPWVISGQVGSTPRGIVVVDHGSMKRDFQPDEIRGMAAAAREQNGDIKVFAREGAPIPECLSGHPVVRFRTNEELTRALDRETRRPFDPHEYDD